MLAKVGAALDLYPFRTKLCDCYFWSPNLIHVVGAVLTVTVSSEVIIPISEYRSLKRIK